jgi:hypothetical protein
MDKKLLITLLTLSIIYMSLSLTHAASLNKGSTISVNVQQSGFNLKNENVTFSDKFD